MDSKVKISSLKVSYGEKEALKGVSFDVLPNEILGIIGPAQSGKTTLLKVINRTIDNISIARLSGTVQVDGQDVYRVKDVHALRRKIGMVAPLPVGLPMSIYENVAFAPRTSGLNKKSQLDEIVERCLTQAALWDEVKDRLDAMAGNLSLGQQQRLVIARAIAVEPEVLLLDEPASSLDPISTLRIEELIYELKSDYTIVIVTHNMQQAGRVSDYTAFMSGGRLIEFDTTDRIFTNPSERATEDYITGRVG